MWQGIVITLILIGLVVLFIVGNEEARQKREKQRIATIRSNQPEWGEAICEYLIQAGQDPNSLRVGWILSHIDEWSREDCLLLLRRGVRIGMPFEMVMVAMGDPDIVDCREVNAKWEKYRWIYGTPRHGAAYIWFKDDHVVRMRQ